MIGTVSTDHQKGNGYLTANAKKDAKNNFGAETLYVHTGMVFEYGDVTLEVLFTPDDLFIADRCAFSHIEQPPFFIHEQENF